MSPEEWLSSQNNKEKKSSKLSPEEWLASQTEQHTTAKGVAGAMTRGMAPVATGALLGAAAGSFLGGVGAIPGAAAGAGAGGLAEPVGDPIVNLVNKAFGTNITLPSVALEKLYEKLGVAKPQTSTERVIQSVTGGASGAGGMAATGKAIQMAAGETYPITAGVGRMIAAQPVQQIAGGAASGLASQAASEAGVGALGQAAAGIAGGMAGAKTAGMTTRPKVVRPTANAPDMQSSINAAESAGIPVMTSDVLPPDTFIGKSAQKIGERIPFVGTGSLRSNQQKSRVEAVRNLLSDYGAEDIANASNNVMEDLAKKRSADLNKYVSMKSDVLNNVASAGKVPVNNTINAIDASVVRLEKLKTEQVTPIINNLNDFKNAIQDQNINNIELLRKQLGENFKSPELSAIRSTAEKEISSIYEPLRQDMTDFIVANGNRKDALKWNVANKRLSEMAGELNINSLKYVLKRGDATPEVINNMIFSKKPSELELLSKNLTEDGRANARTAILAKVADKSATELADGTRQFSPEKFNSEIKRLSPQINVFFKGDDKNRIAGLSRALTLTQRAGTANVSTQTGQEASPFVAGSLMHTLTGSFLGSVAAAGGVGALAHIYESRPVRNLLFSLSKTTKGSKEEAAVFKRLNSVMQNNTLDNENKGTQ